MHRVDARSLSRNADSERFNRGPERLGSSVIKVVFHDRQSQVMGVYTAVLSISGLLGTASVMPALEAGGVWWGPFAVWGLAALAPLVWAVGFGGVPLPVPERKEKRLEKSGAPVALLVWFVAIQRGSPSPLRR